MKMTGSTLAIIGVAAFFLMSRGAGPAGASGMIVLPNGNRIAPDGTIYSASGQVIGHGTPTDYARAVALRGQASGQSPATILAMVKNVAGLAPSVYSALSKMLGGAGGTMTNDEIAALRDQGLTTDLSASIESGDVTGGNMSDADIAALRDYDLTTQTSVDVPVDVGAPDLTGPDFSW